MPTIKIGMVVRDKISGFEGTVVALTEWVTGCRTAGIQAAALHEGKPIELQWFDEVRLLLLADAHAGLTPGPVSGAANGGPHETPRRQVRGC